jgi:signal recognition particle GTPase
MPEAMEQLDDEQQQQQQQQQEDKAKSQTSKKVQQQEQARQETLQKKVDRGQDMLTFKAYDRAVIAQLPEFVQQQVPFITTAKGAVDSQLLEFIKNLVTSNVSFSTITRCLKEVSHTQYYRRMLTYCSFAKEAAAYAVAARGECEPVPVPAHKRMVAQ